MESRFIGITSMSFPFLMASQKQYADMTLNIPPMRTNHRLFLFQVLGLSS